MSIVSDHEVPSGLADLPLAVRRRIDAEEQRRLDEALTRRHVVEAEYQRRYLALHLVSALTLAAKLRGG